MDLGSDVKLRNSTTTVAAIAYQPLDRSTLVALVAVGTALVLFISVLITCGLLLLLRRLGCLHRFKLEKKRSPGKQQDEADRNRYSVISQTKAEVEMLKIETLQTNENGHAVDKQAKAWPEKREETVPLMRESLPSACSPYEVIVLNTDTPKRNSWGTRNTSFRLGVTDREQVVENLAKKVKLDETKPNPDQNKQETPSVRAVENNNAVEAQAKEVKKPRPEGIATVHHQLPRRASPSSTRPSQPPNTRPNNSIHYDIPRINPKPVSVVYVNKYSDSEEEKHIPGMVMTKGSDIPVHITSPAVKPLRIPEPSNTPASVPKSPESAAQQPQRPQLDSPKTIPPWERYSNPSTPVNPPAPSFPTEKRSSLRRSSSGLSAATETPTKPEKPKPKVPPKRISLDQFLRQKASGQVADPSKRATIAGSTATNPIYATPQQALTPRRVATVRPTSSHDKSALLERLERQYSMKFPQQNREQKTEPNDKTTDSSQIDSVESNEIVELGKEHSAADPGVSAPVAPNDS